MDGRTGETDDLPEQTLGPTKESFFQDSDETTNVTTLERHPAASQALPAKKFNKEDLQEKKKCCKLSGSCLCKLSIVGYLGACIIISALYVVFYGKNQALFGDAWIPGKV